MIVDLIVDFHSNNIEKMSHLEMTSESLIRIKLYTLHYMILSHNYCSLSF